MCVFSTDSSRFFFVKTLTLPNNSFGKCHPNRAKILNLSSFVSFPSNFFLFKLLDLVVHPLGARFALHLGYLIEVPHCTRPLLRPLFLHTHNRNRVNNSKRDRERVEHGWQRRFTARARRRRASSSSLLDPRTIRRQRRPCTCATTRSRSTATQHRCRPRRPCGRPALVCFRSRA